VVGKDVGFDLIEYDWVPPYGKGKHSDFIFHLKSRFSGNRDYDFTLTLQFNNGNGIQPYTEDLNQGSIFKLPRFAPEDSYMNALEIYTRHIPGGQLDRTLDENKHYIFRVRAVVEDNRVTEALYGKILGDINVRPQKDGKAKVDFTYYLNPDRTRNLEFDPSRNLFTDLTDLERVGIK
jgi:hypothetical protein